jgi:hypothetical protein
MRFLVLTCLLIGGCAGVAESDCRTSDWYALGERDATLGQRPLIERYTEQCVRYGARPTPGDYLAGWAIGYSKTSFRQPN